MVVSVNVLSGIHFLIIGQRKEFISSNQNLCNENPDEIQKLMNVWVSLAKTL